MAPQTTLGRPGMLELDALLASDSWSNELRVSLCALQIGVRVCALQIGVSFRQLTHRLSERAFGALFFLPMEETCFEQ